MLKKNDIELRALKKEDVSLFYKWRNDLEYIKFTKSIRFPKHEGLEEEWLHEIMTDKSNRHVVFIIEVQSNSIGFVQLSHIDWISRNAYYGIALCEPDFAGKGIGSEVTSMMLDYAFKELNLHKLSVEVTSFNANSKSMFDKLNFKEEGQLKDQFFWDDVYHDVILMGLINE